MANGARAEKILNKITSGLQIDSKYLLQAAKNGAEEYRALKERARQERIDNGGSYCAFAGDIHPECTAIEAIISFYEAASLIDIHDQQKNTPKLP